MAENDLWPDIPAVCFDPDLQRIFQWKQRTIQKRRRAGTFPIPELPRVDRRHRYSRRDVIAFLERDTDQRIRNERKNQESAKKPNAGAAMGSRQPAQSPKRNGLNDDNGKLARRREWLTESTETMLLQEIAALRAENRELPVNLETYRGLTVGALENVAQLTKRNHYLAKRIEGLVQQLRSRYAVRRAA